MELSETIQIREDEIPEVWKEKATSQNSVLSKILLRFEREIKIFSRKKQVFKTQEKSLSTYLPIKNC